MIKKLLTKLYSYDIIISVVSIKETTKFIGMIIICVTSSVGRAHDF